MNITKSDNKSVLQASLSTINQQSHLMKQCLDENNLLQALKHCSNFLNELRITQISPKQYYELYMAIFDSLDYLSNHLLNSYNAKLKKNSDTPFLSDLYELVQYSGNIVPRLYMMIVIGTTFMSTKNAPKDAIMKDMIEMCRGVQNPIRGLFLRYYLSQRIKDLLPIDNEVEFNGTVEFLINNFIEMNKLWVRLQHQGHSSERELRYKERKELKILVGSNLVRLSQIIDDYKDIASRNDQNYKPEEYYSKHIFPVITEQIIQCRDHLAQSYLMDVIIQIFPDTFHFITLNDLLNKVILNLNPTLNKSELVSTLIERFINYYQQSQDDEQLQQQMSYADLKLFDDFWSFYENLGQTDLPLEEHSLILHSFIKLNLVFEPSNYENLNVIYKYVTENFTSSSEIDEKIWLNLLIAPIQNFDSIFNLLNLFFFNEFYSKLTNPLNQMQISREILNKLLNSTDVKIETQQDINTVFKYLSVMIQERNDLNVSKQIGLVKTIKVDDDKLVSNDFLANQSNICKVLHKVDDVNLFEKINNLQYIKRKYLNKNPSNIIYTYPTLIQIMLNVLKMIGFINFKKKGIYKAKLINQFKNLSIIIDELYEHHQQFNSRLVLNLYLNCAIVTDQLKLSSLTNEFFNKCFIVYEENLMMGGTQGINNPYDSLKSGSVQYQSIILILNKLCFIRNMNKEEYEALITKLTIYGSKLLKKQDQCRSVYNCSHLFYWTELLKSQDPEDQTKSHEEQEQALYKSEKKVMDCLQKSLRTGDSCIDPYLSLKLFIEILNKCLNFYTYGNSMVNASYLNGLIQLIHTNFDNLKENFAANEDGDNKELVLFEGLKAYFNRTLGFIQLEKETYKFDDLDIKSYVI